MKIYVNPQRLTMKGPVASLSARASPHETLVLDPPRHTSPFYSAMEAYVCYLRAHIRYLNPCVGLPFNSSTA